MDDPMKRHLAEFFVTSLIVIAIVALCLVYVSTRLLSRSQLGTVGMPTQASTVSHDDISVITDNQRPITQPTIICSDDRYAQICVDKGTKITSGDEMNNN